jgi:hypothetical protein
MFSVPFQKSAGKFDEGAWLPIADLGRNRFCRTSCNQQLFPFIARTCLRLTVVHGFRLECEVAEDDPA